MRQLPSRSYPRAKLLPLLIASCFAMDGLANPVGPSVVSGTVGLATSGQTLTVTNSPNAIINWQGFSIGAGEITRFQQQSAASAVLNRVVGQDPSAILGTLSSNGRVFLVNPSGILFGQGARVDVAGLVATTLNISNNDFLAGRLNFEAGAVANSIVNRGEIVSGSGGRVLLIASDVQNHGLISSPQGEVVLAAGRSVQLVEADLPMLKVEVQAGGEALNVGRILAEGGRIGVYAGLIKQSGIVRADSITTGPAGQIQFKASGALTLDAGSVISADGAGTGGAIEVGGDVVLNSGQLSANGLDAGSIAVTARNYLGSGTVSADGSSGTGGAVSVSATGGVIQTASELLSARGASRGGSVSVSAGGQIFSSATIDSSGGLGGSVAVLAQDIRLNGATLDASGRSGGGTILVGGDYKGSNPAVSNASTNWINYSTQLRAEAGETGNGGKVIVWSENDTRFGGSISVRGGAQSGDGGFVEVSGKENLAFAGLVDAQAPNGVAGSVLLDPKNIVIDAAATGSISSFQLADPNPGSSEQFATAVVALSNGNVVATDRNDTFGGNLAGAAYLFNSKTGALISTITGGANDEVGSGGVTALSGNNNFVVRSPNWGNGTSLNYGAVTWGNGSTGFSGAAVSSSNSLVGPTAGDSVGSGGVTALTNGNYVVASPSWRNAATTASFAGAVTWGNGATGITGTVSSANSLVGTVANSSVGGGGVVALTNGNYVVVSDFWNDGSATVAGAVTWRSGTAASAASVSAANSLVGTTTNDQVGNGGVTALTNGNYVVNSWTWNNTGAGANSAGAVTWGSGTSGISGTVSSANSLVGTTASDLVGSGGITALANGNYVVRSSNWDNGAVTSAGAVTWGSGTAGVAGTVSSSNSLVGTTSFDQVGSGGVAGLTNGNYVVASPSWNNTAATASSAGAVTWGNGTSGISGAVSAANSFVGVRSSDLIGTGGVFALSNGNYVIASPSWANGIVVGAGAVTWRDGGAATTGSVTTGNSLVGTNTSDSVGSGGVATLTNGNYVVVSPSWNNGGTIASGLGATTWGNGTTGTTGTVGASNSLVGSVAGDRVGYDGVTALANGNYVVKSRLWNGSKGAATFGNGGSGTSGTVSSTNSLVGNVADDLTSLICGDGCSSFMDVIGLPGGDYVVRSSQWNNGATTKVGAVTWGSGATGVSGTVSVANSLIGSTADDRLGSGNDVSPSDAVIPVGAGQFIVRSPFFTQGAGSQAGALHVVAPPGSFANPLQFADNAAGTTTITPLGIAGLTNQGTAVTLQASNDITVNSAVTSSNTSGNGGAITLQAGRSVLVKADITTDNGNLSITANDPSAQAGNRDSVPAAGGITMDPATTLNAGTGTVTLTVGSGAAGAPSGNLVVENIVATNVSLQQVGGASGSSILPASASSLIQATNLLMETDLVAGASGASIGTSGVAGPLTGPMRVQVTNLEAHTHQASAGIFIESPSQGLTIGGVPFFSGLAKGVQTLAGGDISLSANGAIANQAGTAGCGLTGGTGGPICASGGNITLRANDLSLGSIVNTAGTLTLAPYTSGGSFKIQSTDVGNATTAVIGLTPSELSNITAGTLAIGAVGTGNIDVDGVTLSATALNLTGGNITVGSTSATALSKVSSSGAMTINAIGSVTLQGSNSGSGNEALITAGGIQNINAANINLFGGEGTDNKARIMQSGASGTQTVTVSGTIIATGGGVSGSGSVNNASIVQSGSGLQHVTAGSIQLTGGGGATGSQNYASIHTGPGSTASQQVDVVGAGGLILQGGTGSGGSNKAGVWVLNDEQVDSGTVATQVVNISGGGSLVATGGSNGTNTPDGNRNSASIAAYATGVGSSQAVTVTGAGNISLTGGPSGVTNSGSIYSLTPSQTVTVGTGGITLQGDGGASGTGNRGRIYQEHSGGSQTIYSGGSIALLGGTGSGGANAGQILSNGSGLQSIQITAPGKSISLAAGSGTILNTATSGNYASIDATAGAQTISGDVTANDPSITLAGGSSGGAAAVGSNILGNTALIRAGVGTQTIHAGAILVNAGTGGIDSSATIQAPAQVIEASTVTIDGGGASGTFPGARIGGIGGTSPGPTDLTLTASGNISLTGGSTSRAIIGSNSLGSVVTDISITSTGGSVSLTAGSGAEARIGSPSGAVGGGDISVTAAGGITLDNASGFGANIRTAGSATLTTTGSLSDITLGGTIDLSAGTTGVLTLDAGHAIVSTGGVLIPNTSATQPINLRAVAGIGTQADPIRFADANLSLLNTGTAGDIAIALVPTSGDLAIDGSLTGVLNSNPTGTYYLKSEGGNVQLDVPFRPDGLPLAAGQSVVFAAPTGSVRINSLGSIQAAGSGNVTLTAGNTSAAGLANGVYVNGGQITAEAGTIALTGYAKLGNTVDGITAGGVVADNGATVHTTSGPINLTGYGGSFASGLDGRSLGIRVTGAGTEISTVDGLISLTGAGGSMADAPGFADTRGIRIDTGALVQATGTGSVTLVGSGGTGVNTALNGGVLVTGATVKSFNGDISIVGSGGSTTGTTPPNSGNYGVSLGDALIESTGAGSVVISGTGGSSESGGNNHGVLIQGIAPNQNIVRTATGSIMIDGTGGSTSVSGGGNSGVQMTDQVLVASTGSGAVTILGQAGSSADSTPNRAILAQGVGVTIQSNSGALELGATGDLYLGDPTGSGQTVSVSTTTGSLTLGATGDLTLGGGTIRVVSGGSQTVTAGGALGLTAGAGTSEYALLQSAGTQNVSASTIDLDGGTAGSGNYARIYSGASQTVSATGISLYGGAGGAAGAGNFAQIRSDASQTINVGSGGLTLLGGSGTLSTETDNFANVYQAGSGGTQTINVGSGGNLVVFGGDAAATNVDVDNNHGSWAFIRSDGTAQTISYSAPGNGSFLANSIQVIGGDNGSGNYAGINARNGTQTITGSPDIFVAGGSSGGISGEGNWAQIYATAGQQSITANVISLGGGDGYENFARLWSGTQQNISAASMLLVGGASGTANFAVLNAPVQVISTTGDLVLVGGGSTATATSGGGSRIGGFGGTTPSATNLALTVGGNLSMTGGDASDSGSAIGNGIAGGQTTDIALDVTGNISLNPGTVVNAGSRIGSPSGAIAGGDIAVTAGGDLVMNGTASGIGTAIRTAGTVALQANAITQGTFTTIAAGQLDVTTAAGASLLGGGNAVSAFSAGNTTSGAIELLNTAPTLTLNGLTQVAGGAINVTQTGDLVLPTMSFGTGTISASGTASIPSGVTFTAAGGTLSAPTLDVQSGGTLNGTGTVTASVTNSGTIAPGTSAGILTVSGNYTQSSTGALTVEIGGTTVGTEYDRLAVSGTASLGGTLNVSEGAVAPVAGTTYTVITCGSCTGTFATVSSPTVNVTPTYAAASFSLPFTAFLNSWNSAGTGAWETASNWSRGVVPGSNDDVVIDDPSSVATVTVSSGTQTARSIVSSENLTLSGGSLNLAAPSTVNGTFTLSGGTLGGLGSLTLNGAFSWSSGTISNTGGLITTGTSTISGSGLTLGSPWSNSGAATISGGELLASAGVTNTGTINLSGASSIRLPSGGPAFTNAAGGTLDIDSTAGWSFVSNPTTQDGIVDNAGTINVNSGTSWEAAFNQAGTGSLNIAAGKFLSLQNGQSIAGTVNVGTGATLWVSERHGVNASFSGTTIGGSGTVQVLGGAGPVADFTNVSAPSATLLVGSGGTANVLAGTTTFAALEITGGTLGGAGTLNVTASLNQSGGSQSGAGTTVLASGATGTLGGVSVGRNLTNLGTLDLSGTSISGLFTNDGTVNVTGTVSASAGLQQNAGLTTVPAGQTLGVGGSGLVLAGGTLMGSGTISGNVNNSAGIVAPGASPGILTINGDYTQGAGGVLAVDVGGTVAGSEYDQLVVNGNVFLDGNLSTTLFGSYTPLPGDSYTFVSATGTITGSFANVSQPVGLLPPVAAVSPLTGAGELIVSVVSPSLPPAIEPTYNYTVVATEISSEPVENILVPVLGVEGTAGTEESSLEKKPPACS